MEVMGAAVVAAEAGAAAILGKKVFDYNRENFMYDRELRLHKEFKELKFRVVQSELWRQDIRDIIGLVETKTKKYLLVNVLMLGFTISLWVQGILPEDTPDWLMMGNQVAIGGAFSFILLTVWLAMHASISAQGFQTRLLTQLVRLPIPSWEELEACRTYGSSYEKVEARHMFRVPFAMGSQENLVPDIGLPPMDDASAASSSGDRVPASGLSAEVATDPWGLESRGDHTYELGCPYNKDCESLRHIRLVRQAQQFWVGYDAFARISMSIGVNQLLLAMSYYILGYVLVQARAPWAAFSGVVSLMGLAQVIAILDMSLPKHQQFIITLLIVAGPMFACIACYHWSHQFGQIGAKVSRGLAPLAFVSHGVLVLVLSYSCQLRETKGGGLLPTAFKNVLYLDVFGWTSRFTTKDELVEPLVLAEQLAPAMVVHTPVAPVLVSAEFQRQCSETSCVAEDVQRPRQSVDVNHYALDYVDPAPEPEELDPVLLDIEKIEHEFDDEEDRLDEAALRDLRAQNRTCGPALQSISYDAGTGQGKPVGVKDFTPAGAHQDLRFLPNAPHKWEEVSHTDRPKEFFDSTSFYPQVGTPMQRKVADLKDAVDPVVSGHDHELPGVVPASVFMFATVLLGSVWIVAAIYQFLAASDLMDSFTGMRIDTLGRERAGLHNMTNSGPEPLGNNNPSSLSSLLQSWDASQAGAEQLDVSLPVSHMLARGLSCDAAGKYFAITDGLSAFVGQTSAKRSLRKQGAGKRKNAVSVDFREVPRCGALLGEALDDTAIACGGSSNKDSSECELLLLHRRGKRVGACPVAVDAREANHGSVAALSQRWLQSNRKSEKAAWLLLDSTCARDSKSTSRMDCASVGTTHGRVAHLRHSESHEPSAPMGALFPDSVMPERSDAGSKEHLQEASFPGMVRAFNARYLGVLQQDRRSIQVLDATQDLAKAGTLTLPPEAKDVDGFCAGGGHVYILSQGTSPQMWRLPLPTKLVV